MTMPDNLDRGVCGACFDCKHKVVEECFKEDVQAFSRYALLSRLGGSPALCQDGGNTYYVCHVRLPGEG